MSHGCEAFLKKFKDIMRQEGLFIIPRAKNNTTITDLGLTKVHIKAIISALSVDDYTKGPEQDHRHPSQEVYVFGKKIGGVEVYIKLTIGIGHDFEIAKCISFHKAEFRMRYPFRSGTKKR